MADNENGQEKTEQPTPKKLRDAKQKGQVPRSQDFNVTVMTIVGSVGLMLMGPGILDDISQNYRDNFTFDKQQLFDPNFMLASLQVSAVKTLSGLLPFWLMMSATAIIAPILLGGWVCAAKNLQPKLEKLNPIKGIGKMFSVKALMELVKSLLKVSVVGAIAALLHFGLRDQLLSLWSRPFDVAVAEAASTLVWALLAMACGMVLIAAIDVPFQIWQHTKELRMTRQEIRDELRDTEGKPEVKAKIRSLQQRAASARMMDEVPTADVVITNPTHFSVALRYDQASMRAPILIAKGTGLIALRIRDIAGDNGVTIVESPPLARALFASTDLNQEIPSPLYLAVAQILGFVFQLRLSREKGTPAPKAPKPDVPDDFMRAHNLDEVEG